MNVYRRESERETGDPTVFDTYVGLRIEGIGYEPLHCTLAFIESATTLDRLAAWRAYSAELQSALPLALQLGEGLQLGEKQDVPARRVRFGDAELQRRLATLYREHTRRENNAFPEWLPHVSVDTADKQAALAAMGDALVVTTLYMTRTGRENLHTPIALLTMRERMARDSD